MSSPDGVCPGLADIERLAETGEASAEVLAHMAGCERCGARLDAARDDARFIGRVRTLAGASLGPEGAPRIAGYRALGVVSSGSQGIIYRAVQEATSREVAIKVLATGAGASPRQRLRAEREAEIAARLRHPNIVTVFESRTLSDGRIVVVMEYVDGVPLDRWSPEVSSPEERQRAVLGVFAEVCGAIHHAHLNAVIHRDLKPDNILVTPDGRPVVLDFGIAKADDIGTTATGEFAGTPAYASPEQASGRPDDVDALTDVYSLGVILYRLLCGTLPYELEGSIFDIAHTISTTDPVSPRARNPALSPDLEAIILRAVRKQKERRYQSAASLARDIERYLSGEPVEARSGSGWYLLRKAVVMNRRRLAWAAVAVVVLLGAGLVVILALARAASSARVAAIQREQAHAESVRARAVTELMREALPNQDPGSRGRIGPVDEGLARLYLRLETGAFADDPELDQALRRLWGGLYTDFASGKAAGQVEYAEVSLRNGLERLRLEHRGDHPDVAATMQELSGVLLVRKRPGEAESMARETLAMRERLFGSGSMQVGETRALLARILLALGRTEEASAEADDVLGIVGTHPRNEAELIEASMRALKARVSLDEGAYAEAESLLREALVCRLRRLPPEDPELLESLSDAARLAGHVPNSELARALAGAWGEGDALGAGVRHDLPLLAAPNLVLVGGGPQTGRAAALGRLLRFQEALLGPDDPGLVGVLMAQLRAAQREENPELRAASALRAADVLEKRYGPDAPAVQVCIDEAALTLAMSDHADRAVELARRSNAVRDGVPADARDPLLHASSLHYLGWFLSLAGRHEEAVETYQRAIDEFTAVLGPEHHTIALSQGGMAYSLAEMGQLERAEALSAQALALAQRLEATPYDQLATIEFERGHVLTLMGRGDEAKGLLVRAWEAVLRGYNPSYGWRRVVIADLASIARAHHDEAEAARWESWLDRSGTSEARAME